MAESRAETRDTDNDTGSEALDALVAEYTCQLEQVNERLRELDRLKQEFVSNVSHELRTPLTNIKLYLNLLQNGREDRRERYVEVLVRETARLEALVDDLLNLSRVEMAGAAGLRDRVRVDLADLVTTVVDGVRPRADDKGVAIHLICEPGPCRVTGVRSQLSLVVENLLANAVNYTTAGGSVTVVLEDRGPEAGISFADTGMGMPPDEVPHVFDRFFRGARARNANVPGTGLGLAIVREIVALHGGRVSVDETYSGGAKLDVLLPAEDADDGF